MAISRPRVLRPGSGRPTQSDLCPWCEQPIPHDRFDEIHARIAKKERQRTAEVEGELRKRFARDKAQMEANAKAAVAAAQKEGADALSELRTKAAAKEQRARHEATKAAEAAASGKMLELARAKEKAEGQLKAAHTESEQELKRRLQEQRDALESDQVKKLNAEKSKAFSERQKLEGKLQLLQRQLQRKSADELGEGAEVDLFETLKAEFPDDRIRRVAKGHAGADLVHEVVLHGSVCGRVVYDSKNRAAWQNGFVDKLRKDQLAEKADHAVLTTLKFPSGAQQIHFQDGVIVINPARAIAVVQILRRQVLQSHALRLSAEARAEKSAQIYEFITSERFAQLLSELETLSDDLLDIDVKEHRAHELVWNRRGQTIRTLQKTRGSIAIEIDQIIGTMPTERSA